MSVRTKVKLISFISASVLIILSACIMGFYLANTYKTRVMYTYQRSLSQLSDYVSSIKTTLEKGAYANTPPQQYGFASKLMVQAEGAKNALSQLPVSQSDSVDIQKYLTQVSDFSSFSIGKLSRNETLTKDNLDALRKLSEYADNIAPQIEELSARFGDGSETIGDDMPKNNIESVATTEKSGFDNSFLAVSKSFADYPSLIYDGPFADSVQRKKPRLTENQKEYSPDEARRILSDFLNISASKISYKETRKGRLPVYVFSAQDTYATVTVQGGYVCEVYVNTVSSSPQKYHYEELLNRALTFFSKREIHNMKESYYVIQNGICTMNFAYDDNGVICYGDLIKVGVSAATGDIVSYNAEGYIMNHTDRNFSQKKITVSKAQESVSPLLRIQKSETALIPMDSGKEILCYEFTCKGKDNENVIVYINTQTALEEQIYILLQSDGGTLVM